MPASPSVLATKINLSCDGYCDVEEVGENIRISIGTEPKSVRASITIDRAGARALGAALTTATLVARDTSADDETEVKLAAALEYILERALQDPKGLGYHLGPCTQAFEGACAALAAHRGESVAETRAEYSGGLVGLADDESEDEPDDEHGLADMHDEGDATPDGPVL